VVIGGCDKTLPAQVMGAARAQPFHGKTGAVSA